MRRLWLLIAFSVCPVFLSPVVSHSVELYVKPVVIQENSDLTVGDIVFLSGGVLSPRTAGGRTGPLLEKPGLISARQVKKVISKHLTQDFILIGGYIVYIPHNTPIEHRASFIEGLNEIRDKCEYPVTTVTAERSGDGDIEYTAYADCYVPARNISRGTPLTNELFTVEQRIIELIKRDKIVTKKFAETNALRHFQAGRYLRKGDIVYCDDLEKRDVVKAGSRVVIFHERKNVFLEMRGIAYQSGSVGEIISVKPAHAQRKVSAQIVGPGEVRIESN